MSQQNSKNMNVPLRVYELLPDILAMQEEEEYEDSDGSSPNRSYSDSDLLEHNRGFYKSNYKNEITYPNNNKSCRENFNAYNQTYPSKDLQSCSASKSRSGKSDTPVQTPGKCNKQNGSSKKSYKFATPKSSNKKKTPRNHTKGMSTSKNSAKKTPFKKCLNMDEVFKSTTKNSLFSASKSNMNQHNLDFDRNTKTPAANPASLDELFASGLQIIEDQKDLNHSEREKLAPPAEKLNPFSSNKTNNTHPKYQEVFATPKSNNISSNIILKSCRENNFTTPHKATDISHKFETPSTQNKIIQPRQQQTPLFPIKESSDFLSKQVSAKKIELSVKKDKENHIISTERDGHYRKGLFKDTMDTNERLSVLKEVQLNDQRSHGLEKNFKTEEPKISSLNHVHDSGQISKEDHHHQSNLQENRPRYFTTQKPYVIEETPQKNDHRSSHIQQYRSEKIISSDCNKDVPRSNNFIQTKLNQPQIQNASSQSTELDRFLVSNKNTDSRPMESLRRTSSENMRTSQAQLRQFRMLVLKGKQYTVLGMIGSGGSSEVFKVMDPETSALYAVKCVNMAVDPSMLQGYVNEIKLLQKLQGSDRVITMYDYEYVEKQRKLYVLLEMGDVDLSRLMKGYRARESRLPLPILVCYWTEMLTAVHHIHQNGIIHSDLKPANFLLVHGRLKLIDFGIASALNADATSIMKDCTTGTFNYISPEAVTGATGIKISYKSDVWSLGCILYSMLYGKTPFGHIPHLAGKIAGLTNPHYKIEYAPLQGIPPIIMRAVKWCLTHDVKLRPSVQELINLPYISNVDEVPHPIKRVPLQIMSKIKGTLTNEEWKCVVDILEGK